MVQTTGKRRARRLGRVILLGAAVALAAASLSACEANYPVLESEESLVLPCDGSLTTDAIWAFPDTTVTPIGMIWIQHGFARQNNNMADLMREYAARGYVVVNPSFGAFGTCGINSATLHTAIAYAIAHSTEFNSALQQSADSARARLLLPPLTLPANIVLSGHSAGGALVTAVGGQLASSTTPGVAARLKGLVLLDPVENSDNAMAANLPKLAGVPVRTISGANSSCNANGSGTNVLIPRRSGFVGVRLPSGCHCDAEGATTDGLCTFICGTPQQKNVDALQGLAADWASGMLKGTLVPRSEPGGAYYQQLISDGTIQTITGTA